MPSQTRPRLHAEPRETGRKSLLRALRTSGKIPASIFGHGEPQTIAIGGREMNDFLRHHATGALIDVELSGGAVPALLREIDRDPISGAVIHLGLQRVDLAETVRVTLPLTFHGEEALVAEGLVLQRQMAELEVHGKASELPEGLVVELAGHGAGDSVRVRDLPLPRGVEATRDPETLVATISVPTVPADVAAALDAEVEAAEEREAEHAAAEEAAEEAATA